MRLKAPQGPLLASSKSSRSCNGLEPPRYQSHFDCEMADPTTDMKASLAMDEKRETIELIYCTHISRKHKRGTQNLQHTVNMEGQSGRELPSKTARMTIMATIETVATVAESKSQENQSWKDRATLSAQPERALAVALGVLVDLRRGVCALSSSRHSGWLVAG